MPNQWQPQVGRMQRGQRGLLRTVQQLVRSGKLEEAQGILGNVVTENPDFALGHLLLGNTYFRQRRYDDALAEYQQALERNPQLAPAPVMMGMTYRIANEPKNALQHFELALEIDPDLVLAHVQKGRIHAAQGQAADAMASAKRALEVNPQSVPARLLMAEVHAHRNEEARAAAILEDLVKDRPELVVAHLMLAMLYVKLERLEDAKASLQTATQLAPDRPFPLFMLGNAHYKLKELNAAEKCYRDALKVAENFMPAKYALADVLAAAGRSTEAIGILNTILARARRINSAHQRLGAIYVAQGRHGRAVEEFRAALKHDPEILAKDPTIEVVLDTAADEETAAKSFMERLQAIRVQAINELNTTSLRDWVRKRRARNLGRLRTEP